MDNCGYSTEDTMNYKIGSDVFVGVLPFFHIYGQVVVLLTGLSQGCKIVTQSKFDPQLFLDTIVNHKVRAYFGLTGLLPACIFVGVFMYFLEFTHVLWLTSGTNALTLF